MDLDAPGALWVTVSTLLIQLATLLIPSYVSFFFRCFNFHFTCRPVAPSCSTASLSSSCVDMVYFNIDHTVAKYVGTPSEHNHAAGMSTTTSRVCCEHG